MALFENSNKKTAFYAKAQMNTASLNLNENTKKAVVHKIQKACRTRWLSLGKAVKSLYQDYPAVSQHSQCLMMNIMMLLQRVCFTRLNTFKFIAVIYILNQIILILDTVSKTFQKGTITFSQIAPNLAYVKMKLQEEALSHKAITDAVKDLKPNGRLTLQGVEVQVTQQGMVEVDNQLHKFVDALIHHLHERFRNSLPLFSQLRVFDPLLLPSPDSVSFLEYGKDEIQKIRKIYMYAKDKVAEVVAEFELFKFHMASFNIPAPDKLTGETQTEVVLKKLLQMGTLFHLLSSFVDAVLSLPVTNAWPERGASAIKRIKTRLRACLSNKMLESLLHISVNGPEVCTEEFEQLIRQAVTLWLGQRAKKKRTPGSVLASKRAFVSTGTQFEPDDTVTDL